MPLQKTFLFRIPGMESHHQTYAVLGKRGQVSGGLRWTVGQKAIVREHSTG